MSRFLPALIPVLILCRQAVAGYDVNPACQQAWMLVMDLRIPEAKQLLAEEIRRNPANYYAHYLDQTCEVFRLMINSTQQDYEQFIADHERRRAIMDGKDESSPWYLTCAAEMDLQVSVFSIMHGAQWSGLTRGYSAYKKVYRNLEKFPAFKPNHKLDGFFNVAIANLPPFVKWAISFFGVKVDIDYGFNVLHGYYRSQKEVKGLNAEAALFIILAAKINKTPEQVYAFTKSLDSAVAQTFIHTYFRANIAYRTGRNEEALTVLRGIRHDPEELHDVLYSYLMGKILLRKQDPQAGIYLSNYLARIEKKEYVKEINYGLALFYLLNGNTQKYIYHCHLVRNTGMDLNERDREALYEVNLDYTPDVNLVKARLSLDGGYLEACDRALADYGQIQPGVLGHALEYHFLKGRYEARRGNRVAAMAEFRKVIEQGESRRYFFASEAALRLGWLCQETGQPAAAAEWYKKSLKLYRSDYYEYIEDKATKSLNSLQANSS